MANAMKQYPNDIKAQDGVMLSEYMNRIDIPLGKEVIVRELEV